MSRWSPQEIFLAEDMQASLDEAEFNGELNKPVLIDTIQVSQDVGGPFAVYKRVDLLLFSDGTVKWKVPTVITTEGY